MPAGLGVSESWFLETARARKVDIFRLFNVKWKLAETISR